MKNESAILREQIARYRSLLALTTDERAKKVIERLIKETQDRLNAMVRPRSPAPARG